jgi:hypothetical protein
MRPGWNQPEPDPDRGAPPAATVAVRTGSQPRILTVGSVLVALFLLIAIVKPWYALGLERPDAPDGLPPSAAVSVPAAGSAAPGSAARSPEASGAPSPSLAPGQLDCGAPDGWRLVTLGWLAGRPSSMQAAVAAVPEVSGPADPGVGSLSAGEAPVAAVGACEPGPTPGLADDRASHPSVRVVGAWRVDGPSPAPVPLRDHGPAAASAQVVQLYAPRTGTWGAGRYVLELEAAQAGTVWVGFTIGLAPSPAPRTIP